MYGKDINYAKTRLLNTVVQDKDGKPFTVNDINNGGVVLGSDINGHNIICNLDEVQLKEHKLGFVIMNGKAVYVMRKPLRNDWRQGLRPNNVIGVSEQGVVPVRFQQIMESLEGRYVKLEHVEQALRDVRSVPISRSFAINRNHQVLHGVSGVVGMYRAGKVAFTKGFEDFKKLFLLEVGDEGIAVI